MFYVILDGKFSKNQSQLDRFVAPETPCIGTEFPLDPFPSFRCYIWTKIAHLKV